jgi:hypothetical protein
MHRERLNRLRLLLETVDEDDPLFNIYSFLGEEGRYDPSVVACRDPFFQSLGLNLEDGKPCYRFQDHKPLYGLEAVKVFFGISIAETRRIFGPLSYGKIDVRPSDVRYMISTMVAETESEPV